MMPRRRLLLSFENVLQSGGIVPEPLVNPLPWLTRQLKQMQLVKPLPWLKALYESIMPFHRGITALMAFIISILIVGKAQAQYQSSYVTPPLSSEAASLFQQGTASLRANRNQEAAQEFEGTCKLAPDFAESHHQWAIALLKLGRSDEAIDQFNQAIKLFPGCAASWLSLAGAYQSAGKVNEAIVAYKAFIVRFPHDDDVPRVRALIDLLGKENSTSGPYVAGNQSVSKATPPQLPVSTQTPLKAAPKQSPVDVMVRNMSQGTDNSDYWADVTRGGVLRWPVRRMPLHVYIENGDSIPGFRSTFPLILRNAFLEWANASAGLVSCLFVNDPAKADIVCKWSANTSKFKNSAESAEVKLYSDRNGLAKGEIEILTLAVSSSLPLTDTRLRGTSLHEVGHVLGLAGHTKNPADIMFFSAPIAETWKELSQRDKNTLVRLYSGK